MWNFEWKMELLIQNYSQDRKANLLVSRATALCIGSETLLSSKLRCKKFQQPKQIPIRKHFFYVYDCQWLKQLTETAGFLFIYLFADKFMLLLKHKRLILWTLFCKNWGWMITGLPSFPFHPVLLDASQIILFEMLVHPHL